MTESASFSLANADIAPLGAVLANLARLGFSETGLRDRLGLRDIADLNWRSLPVYRDERLHRRDPLDLAIDLFHLQAILPAAELDQLLTAEERDLLVRVGLLSVDSAGAGGARASLYPVGGTLIFSDHAWPQMPHPGHTSVPYNQVMYIGLDSRHLARCTTRRNLQNALDLCTGSGIHALLASAHAANVLAVDISPRAVACTRFNAHALGIANLQASAGDLFEPAGDQKFDLITANPPFVPSPLDSLGFRDGGRSGEDIQQRIIAGLPHHLAPGGIAQIVTELGERDGEPLVNRLRQWLNGAPLDIHILRLREFSAAAYATGHAQGEEYDAFLDSVRSWAANLRSQGYQRVISVILTFQWTGDALGQSWDREDEAVPPARAAGHEIEAIFNAERLIRCPDLAQRLETGLLSRTGPVALVDARLLGGTNVTAKATLLGQGLTLEYPLDPVEREVVARLENGIALRQLVSDCGPHNPGSVVRAVVSLLRKRLARLTPLIDS